MANEDLKTVLDKFAMDVIADIKANMKDLSDSALANSLNYEIIEDGEGFHVNIIANEYWDFAQKGSAPWTGSGNGEFIKQFPEIIREWVKKRGISEEYVQPIVWSIVKKGSSINRGERPQRDFLGTAIQDNLDKLSAEWREKVKDVLMNGLSKLK